MIGSVRLENFKSFKDSTVHLAPMTLIIGANGAGKSNFFDGMRFLRAMGEGVTVRAAIEGHATSIPTDASIAGIRGGRREIVYFGAPDQRFKLTVKIRTATQSSGANFVATPTLNARLLLAHLRLSTCRFVGRRRDAVTEPVPSEFVAWAADPRLAV